jgi:hypothetical protein
MSSSRLATADAGQRDKQAFAIDAQYDRLATPLSSPEGFRPEALRPRLSLGCALKARF